MSLDRTDHRLDRFAKALAAPGAHGIDLFRLVAADLCEEIGVLLVTVTAVDPADLSFERLYSSMPEVFAVSGRKPANQTRWSRQVLEDHETFVANDYGVLAETMPDHATSRAAGCESLVNVPIVLFGEVIGTLNCLAGDGHFDESRVRACEDMRVPVMLGLLVAARARTRPDRGLAR